MKVQLWTAHGCSLLTYAARFVPPSAEIQRAFRRSAQKICQVPWMSFPMGMLHSTDLVGGVALRDPVRAGQAARWGVIRTSAALHEAWSELDSALSDDRNAPIAMGDGPHRRACTPRTAS